MEHVIYIYISQMNPLDQLNIYTYIKVIDDVYIGDVESRNES